MLRLNNRYAKVILVFLLGIVLYSVSYLICNYYVGIKRATSDSEAGAENINLFYTNLHPIDLMWTDNSSLRIKTEDQSIKYDIAERRHEKIDQYQNYLCITNTYEIQNREQIATEIQILNESDKDRTITLKTNLTLNPVNCSLELLILTPTFPLAQDEVYVWRTDKDQPAQLLIEPYSGATITKVKYNSKAMLAGIYYSDKTLLKYDLNNDTYIELNNVPKTWDITDTGKIISLEQNNNDLIIKSLCDRKEKTLCTTRASESFIDIITSPDLNSHALISNTGELWILTKQRL
ncbi:MAG: hypothetical protein U9Q67_01320 [Patescibacteria group bacterium]|nr:hypothetical protein [Patescibacteria group bacterium]